MFLIWHLWLTTTNLFYRFSIFETSATASCGSTGRTYSSNMCNLPYIRVQRRKKRWNQGPIFSSLFELQLKGFLPQISLLKAEVTDDLDSDLTLVVHFLSTLAAQFSHVWYGFHINYCILSLMALYGDQNAIYWQEHQVCHLFQRWFISCGFIG